MVRSAVLCLVLLAACEPPPPHPRSVEDFQDEPAVAQGVLARCMANKAAAARDVECENARVAMERGAVAEDAKHVGDKQVSEEKAREEILARREAERRATEARSMNKKFDPYSSPVGEEPPPAPGPPKTD